MRIMTKGLGESLTDAIAESDGFTVHPPDARWDLGNSYWRVCTDWRIGRAAEKAATEQR